MLRLIVRTRRKNKTKNKEVSDDKKSTSDKEWTEDERSQQNTTADSDDGNSTHARRDQDSNVSFQIDSDNDMDTAEVGEEEWIEYIKRRTGDAQDKMKATNIPCWIETQRKMKWRLEMRIASRREEGMDKKSTKNGIQVSALKQKKTEE